MGGRLMNPGPGELCDRMSVLTLKLLHKPSDEYRREFEEIIMATAALFRASAFQVEDLLALAAVNGELWGHEDQIRHMRAREGLALPIDEQLLLRVGMEIQELNDRRAQLIAEINSFHKVGT